MCNVAVCHSVIVVGFFLLRRGLFLLCRGLFLSRRENFQATGILYGGNKGYFSFQTPSPQPWPLPAQEARCKAKVAAIDIARGGRRGAPRPRLREASPAGHAASGGPGSELGPARDRAIDRARASVSSGPLNWVPGANGAGRMADWSEDVMDITEEESSGIAPPMAV